MLKEGEIYFNENKSLSLNLYLENYPSIPIANEEYEEVEVEGRNGSLTIKNGTYENKKLNFSFDLKEIKIIRILILR